MIITKERINKLTDDTVTKREYDAILEDISDRVNDIWRFICKETHRELDWWSFENDIDYNNGNGSIGGEFDPYTCANYITLIGDWTYKKQDLHSDGFDIELLWDELWQQTIRDNIQATTLATVAKALKEKNKREAKKQKKALLIDSIKSKLTAEELKVVKFK